MKKNSCRFVFTNLRYEYTLLFALCQLIVTLSLDKEFISYIIYIP